MIHHLLLVLGLGLASTGLLPALQINLTYATNGQPGSIPAGDGTGNRLMALAQSAADYWEDIIEDNHSIDITVRYDNGIGAGLIGLWTMGNQSNGRPDTGTIGIRGTTTWFYDTTPNDHSEYQLGDRLFRDATVPNAANFTGPPPGVLEIGSGGPVAPGAPAAAANGTDLYSVLLHELGHAVGMSSQLTACSIELLDGDFDIDPNLANGNSFQVITGGNTGAHTACTNCLLNPTIAAGQRTLPSATDVLAIATSPDPGWTDIDLPRQDFLPGGTTDWNTASNWIGGQLPGNADDAACRYGIDVPGNPLLSLSANASCRNLLMSGSTTLRTSSFKMKAFDTVTIDYDGNLPVPEIFVQAGGELEAVDVVVNGGDLDMNGGLADLSDDLILSEDTLGRQGNVSGYGIVDVAGTLVNDGRITATDDLTLTFQSVAASPWDLDGTSGDGEVHATTGHLDFASGGLTDDFDGTLQINAPYSTTIASPWQLGSGGIVNLTGGNPDEATLDGGLFTVPAGKLNAAGLARISSPLILNGTSETLIFPFSTLALDDATAIADGAILLAANATLACEGPTSILGGNIGMNADSQLVSTNTLAIKGGGIAGSGTLRISSGSTTKVDDGISIGVDVTSNGGTLQPGSALATAAEITLKSYTLWSGTLAIDLLGTPDSGKFDHLIVDNTAQLGGQLEVNFNVPGALPGDTWKILSAANVIGNFNIITAPGVPVGQRLVSYTTDDGVYLKLQQRLTYATWAASHNLLPPDDGIDDDADGDGLQNGLEMFLGGDPNVPDAHRAPSFEIFGTHPNRYLSLIVELDADTVPIDLWLTGTRSTDLSDWTGAGVLIESTDFDPDTCLEIRRYRSTTPIGSIPKEFLRLEANYPDL